MTAAFPNTRMHDDGTFNTHHRKRTRRAGRGRDVVVHRDHVAIPRVANVAFEFGSQRAIVPETLDATVDF